MWTRANCYCVTHHSSPCYAKYSSSEIQACLVELFTYLSRRPPFDWAFVQCGPEQLSEAQYRCFLTSAVFDDPMPFFEAKVALNVIANRLISQQGFSSIGSDVLLLIVDIMQAGKSCLRVDDFRRLKEHLFDIPQINALFTSSTISTEVIEQGIEPRVLWKLRILYFVFVCRDSSYSRCDRGSDKRL
jgi:hypothetical protein